MVVDEPALGVPTPLRCSPKSRRTPPEVLQCPSRTASGLSKLIHYHLGFVWNRVPPGTPKSARSSSSSHEIAVLGGIPHPQTHPFGFLSSRWLGYPTMLKMSTLDIPRPNVFDTVYCRSWSTIAPTLTLRGALQHGTYLLLPHRREFADCIRQGWRFCPKLGLCNWNWYEFRIFSCYSQKCVLMVDGLGSYVMYYGFFPARGNDVNASFVHRLHSIGIISNHISHR